MFSHMLPQILPDIYFLKLANYLHLGEDLDTFWIKDRLIPYPLLGHAYVLLEI